MTERENNSPEINQPVSDAGYEPETIKEIESELTSMPESELQPYYSFGFIHPDPIVRRLIDAERRRRI